MAKYVSCSRWTKRRKVLSAIQRNTNDIVTEFGEDEINLIDIQPQQLLENNENIDIPKTVTFTDTDTSDSNTSDSYVNDINDNSNFVRSDPELEHSDFESNSSNDDISDSDSNLDLRSKLAKWALEFKTKHCAISKLLCILRETHRALPKDARTLLKTPKTTLLKKQKLAGGEFVYIGIKENIVQRLDLLLGYSNVIKIKLNFDGLPLFKSSNCQFWPILGCFENKPKDPFVIGLYCGEGKPSSVKEYLQEFVLEANNLQTNGFNHNNGQTIKMEISAVICDAPARAFIKQTKGHTGYSGCERCTQEGVYIDKRMTFPVLDAPLRTDTSFREKNDEDHHIGTSPFTDLTIDMVTKFPLDYMHLVCLGVTRKLIFLWMKGPLKNRIGVNSVKLISRSLIDLKSSVPCEFARKPRSLLEVNRWKATEFRQFLLYTGPVVLKNNLPDHIYNNFMLLSLGVYIMLNPNLCHEYLEYAAELINLFVVNYGQIYGKCFLTYNVHCLIHLAQDVQKYGALDNVSAFVFENYLGKLKRMIRKPQLPLQQVVNRLSEMKENDKYEEESTGSNNKFHMQHQIGPLPDNMHDFEQYKEYQNQNYRIKITSGNNCVIVGDKIGLVCNILRKGSNELIIFKQYQQYEPFFNYPVESSSFGMYRVSNLGDEMCVKNISEITKKCVLLRVNDNNIAIPFLH